MLDQAPDLEPRNAHGHDVLLWNRQQVDGLGAPTGLCGGQGPRVKRIPPRRQRTEKERCLSDEEKKKMESEKMNETGPALRARGRARRHRKRVWEDEFINGGTRKTPALRERQ